MAKRQKLQSPPRAGRRWPLTAERLCEIRRLAKAGRTADEAAGDLGLDPVTFGRILRDKKRAADAWLRGHRLYSLARMAESGTPRPEAAAALEMSADELDALLADDAEMRVTWTTGHSEYARQLRSRLQDQAREGSVAALRQLLGEIGQEGQRAASQVDFRALTQQQILEVLQPFIRTRQSLNLWEKETPASPRNKDGTYPLADFLVWFVARRIRQAAAGGPGTAEDEDLRLKRARREKIELENRHRRAELLDRNEVIAGLVARAQTLVAWLEGKPSALAAVLQGQPPARIVEYLDKEFAELRRTMMDPPEVLRLPPGAAETFRLLLSRLAKGGGR